VTVENRGVSSAGFFGVAVYEDWMSPDPPSVWNTGDSTEWIDGLDPGASVNATLWVSYDAEGTYRLWAQVDILNYVDESNEGNNHYGPLSAVIGRPDLVISNISPYPIRGLVSTDMSVTVTVTNQGGTVADPGFWDIQISMYQDRQTEPAAPSLGDDYAFLPALAAGESANVTLTAHYDSEGAYNLWALVDSWENVDEANEDNNAYGPVSVYIGRPDLVITNISPNPAKGFQNRMMYFDLTVENQGASDADLFWVDVWKSTPSSQQGDILLGYSGLGAGESATKSLGVWYNAPGTYEMWARVDWDKYVDESNEANNEYGPVSVEVECERCGCFIATAAYGSPMAKELDTFRAFRDSYLLTNGGGSRFVSLYYRYSPPVAEFIDEHPVLKPIVRTALLPPLAYAAVVVNTTLTQKVAISGSLILIGIVSAWLLLRRRRTVRIPQVHS
jgi:subtilase family serine protease